jgi:hypothetical protein
VILKRATSSVHKGTYPPGFNFMTNLRGRHVRRLLKMGGRLASLESNYIGADLEGARKRRADPTKPSDAPPAK